MFAIVQDNEIVATGSIRKLFPNTSFPAGGASVQFKQEHNVLEILEGPQEDQRFFWVTPANPAIQLINGLPTRVYINTPKELEDRPEVTEEGEPLLDADGNQVITKGLKSQWISQVKENANKSLAPTDWVVTRKAERGVEIPADIAAERAQIIADCEAKEVAIQACTAVEELKEVLFPSAPSIELEPVVISGNLDS